MRTDRLLPSNLKLGGWPVVLFVTELVPQRFVAEIVTIDARCRDSLEPMHKSPGTSVELTPSKGADRRVSAFKSVGPIWVGFVHGKDLGPPRLVRGVQEAYRGSLYFNRFTVNRHFLDCVFERNRFQPIHQHKVFCTVGVGLSVAVVPSLQDFERRPLPGRGGLMQRWAQPSLHPTVSYKSMTWSFDPDSISRVQQIERIASGS